MGFIGPIQMEDRGPFFFLRSREKLCHFSCFFLDCTKPEMRNILAVPGPTLGSWRPGLDYIFSGLIFDNL